MNTNIDPRYYSLSVLYVELCNILRRSKRYGIGDKPSRPNRGTATSNRITDHKMGHIHCQNNQPHQRSCRTHGYLASNGFHSNPLLCSLHRHKHHSTNHCTHQTLPISLYKITYTWDKWGTTLHVYGPTQLDRQQKWNQYQRPFPNNQIIVSFVTGGTTLTWRTSTNAIFSENPSGHWINTCKGHGIVDYRSQHTTWLVRANSHKKTTYYYTTLAKTNQRTHKRNKRLLQSLFKKRCCNSMDRTRWKLHTRT